MTLRTSLALANPVMDAAAALRPISLDVLDATAALQERTDRKYVVSGEMLAGLVAELGERLAILEIDGRRSSAYRSVYVDTPELDSYLDAARRRRHRFKVRTRTYVDTATTMLEVKTKSARGQTIKHRRRHDPSRPDQLGRRGRQFVEDATGRPGLGGVLAPTLVTEYQRSTIVDLDDVARLTVDAGLWCSEPAGRSVRLVEGVVLETKSAGAPSAVDRWLWSNGRRPEKISKYGTGLAALRPDLPANKWHRTLARHCSAESVASRGTCRQ